MGKKMFRIESIKSMKISEAIEQLRVLDGAAIIIGSNTANAAGSVGMAFESIVHELNQAHPDIQFIKNILYKIFK